MIAMRHLPKVATLDQMNVQWGFKLEAQRAKCVIPTNKTVSECSTQTKRAFILDQSGAGLSLNTIGVQTSHLFTSACPHLMFRLCGSHDVSHPNISQLGSLNGHENGKQKEQSSQHHLPPTRKEIQDSPRDPRLLPALPRAKVFIPLAGPSRFPSHVRVSPCCAFDSKGLRP